MGVGNSWAATLGIGEQAQGSPNTGVAASVWLPRVSETIQAEKEMTATAAGYGIRAVRKQLGGVRKWAGGITMEFMPIALGLLLKHTFFNVTSASAAAPSALTATPAAGGALTAGTYHYRVAPVYTHTLSAEKHIFNFTSTASAGTTSGGNLTLNLAWTAPPSAPRGYNTNPDGYVIYRGTDGGAATTAVFLAYQAGAGTTYADTGAATNSAIVPVGAMYDHTFTIVAPTSGTTAVRYLTIMKNQDIGSTSGERFLGGSIDKCTISGGNDPSKPVGVQFGLIGLDVPAQVSEEAATFTIEQPVMSWAGRCAIDTVATTILEQFSIDIANGIQRIPQVGGNAYHRGNAPGMQQVTGTISLGVESHAEWIKMRAGTQFELTFALNGAAMTAAAAVSASNLVSVPFQCYIELPECYYTKGGGQQSGDTRMVDALPFVTEAETNGWPTRWTVRNQTASYPNT